MATKLELAESLTIAQLRELAANQDVNLAGLSTKDDIADAVAAGVAKDDLQAYVDQGGDDTVAEGRTEEQENARVEAAAEAEAPGMKAAAESGEMIIQRANPETPTLAQVEASQTEVPAPTPITVQVGDEEVALDAGDQAQAQQRAASQLASQQAHADLAEREKDAAEAAEESSEEE